MVLSLYTSSVSCSYKGNSYAQSDLLDCICLFLNLNAITNVIDVLNEQEYNRTEDLLRARTDQPAKGQDEGGCAREQGRNGSIEDDREDNANDNRINAHQNIVQPPNRRIDIPHAGREGESFAVQFHARKLHLVACGIPVHVLVEHCKRVDCLVLGMEERRKIPDDEHLRAGFAEGVEQAPGEQSGFIRGTESSSDHCFGRIGLQYGRAHDF